MFLLKEKKIRRETLNINLLEFQGKLSKDIPNGLQSIPLHEFSCFPRRVASSFRFELSRKETLS